MRRSWRSVWDKLLLATLLLFGGSLHAANVLIVTSSTKQHYQLATETVRDSLDVPLRTTDLSDFVSVDSDVELVIALGAPAVQAVGRSDLQQPYIAALISSADHRRVATSEDPEFKAPHATLLLDQPLERQVRLAQRVWPDVKRLGLLLSADNDLELPVTPGVELIVRRTSSDSNIVLEQEALLRDVDGLLAVPDRAIFNRQTVHGLLLSAYRLGKPVIGYSRPLVKAGALLSAYCTPDQLGHQIADLAERVLKDQTVPTVMYPREYRVAVNFGIARALGVATIDPSIEARTFRDGRP